MSRGKLKKIFTEQNPTRLEINYKKKYKKYKHMEAK